jgi:GWxTD domain-containing protein
VWRETEASSSSAFRRGERTVLPNPERLYGLFQGDVTVRFTARSRPGDERPWHWVARLLDAEGHALALRESTASASNWLQGGPTFDVSSEPAGGYDVEVKAWQEGDAGALQRRSRFSVAWNRDSWLRNPRDLEDAVHFLLDPDAEEGFAELSPGEQERYMEDFWRRRDPTPETAENEARTGFLRRVDYVNATYTRAGLGKGMFSDMGRVYIRYGPPSETHHQVIPTGSETLEQVLNELAVSESRSVGDVWDKKLGGDLRPFEVWIYEPGTGLPPDADPGVSLELRRQRRLLFLFVDEHGLGDYRLRYSTE